MGMMFFVRMAGLGGLLLAGGCVVAPVGEHGPVSDRVLKKLNAREMSRAEMLAKVKSGEMRVTLRPPAERTIAVPLRLEGGTPHVMVGINGKPGVRMALDTGAIKTMIHATDAVAHQVKVLPAEDVTVSMHGVMGEEKGRLGILEPLQIGSWELYGYPCVIRTHDNTLRSSFGSVNWKSNLLGFDVAAKLATFLTLDYRAGRAVYGFHEAFTPPKGGHVASGPFTLRQGSPFITLRAGGQSWEALVDTGSFNGIEISQGIAARLKVGQGEAVRGLYLLSVGGTTTSAAAGLRTVTVPEVTVLGETYRKAQVDVAPGPPRVGSFFLKDYRVTFDFRRRLLWLEW